MAGKVLGVGLVGLGYWGKILHRNFMEHPGFEVEAIVKRSKFTQAEKSLYASHSYTSNYDELLRNIDVDIMAIATNARSHVSLAIRALNAGKHVFMEKPPALSVAEMDELLAAADTSGRTVLVDHTFLYTPGFHAVQKVIAEECLGTILHFHSTRADFGLIQTDADILYHLLYHDLYIVHALWQTLDIQNISAFTSDSVVSGISDIASVGFQLRGGHAVTIMGSMLWPHKDRKIIIAGTKGVLCWDETKEHPVGVWDHQASYTAGAESVAHQKAKAPWFPPVEQTEALRGVLDSLYENVLSNNKKYYPGNLEQAASVIAAIEKIEKVSQKATH